MFGKLQGGTLIGVPRSYTRSDGTLLTGFDQASEEVWRIEGFLPVVAELPIPDNVNNYTPEYAVVDGTIELIAWRMGSPTVKVADIAAVLFVNACQKGDLTDATLMVDNIQLFTVWQPGFVCSVGTIVQDKGELYQTIIDVTEGQAHYRPSESPSFWLPIADPNDEWPPYVAPTGAHDAYELGNKASFENGKFISIFDGANIWPPTAGVSNAFWEYVGPLEN